MRVGELPEQVTHSLCWNTHVLPYIVPGHVELVKPDEHETLVPVVAVMLETATPPQVEEKLAATVLQSDNELLAAPPTDRAPNKARRMTMDANMFAMLTELAEKPCAFIGERVAKDRSRIVFASKENNLGQSCTQKCSRQRKNGTDVRFLCSSEKESTFSLCFVGHAFSFCFDPLTACYSANARW